MLTLTRKVGDKIEVGDEIIIVVKEIRGNQVRIGVEAPKDVRIVRSEAKENPSPKAEVLDWDWQ